MSELKLNKGDKISFVLIGTVEEIKAEVSRVEPLYINCRSLGSPSRRFMLQVRNFQKIHLKKL